MEDQDTDIIERYFRNELTSAEREAFERRRAQDEAFREEAGLHGKARQAIRLKEKAEVLPRLSERGRQLYWDGRHADALAQFENLPPLAQSNDNQLFIKAECLLATSRPAEAAALYEQILKNGRSRFTGRVLCWWSRKVGNFTRLIPTIAGRGRAGSANGPFA